MAPTAPTPNVPAVLGGIAWIIAAALTGYLSLQQYQFGRIVGDDSYTGLAAGNGFAALVTVHFGARLLMNPQRGTLGWSVVWAVLNVAWGAYQAAQALVGDLFLAALAAMGVAGILSLAARQVRS